MTVLSRSDFTNAGSDLALQSYTPNTGAAVWSKTGGSDCVVNGSSVGYMSTPDGFSNSSYALNISSANQVFTSAIKSAHNTNDANIKLRLQGGNTCYFVALNEAAPGVYRQNSGTLTLMGTASAGYGDTSGGFKSIEFSVIWNTGTSTNDILLKIGGTTVFTGTDASITGAGSFAMDSRAVGTIQWDYIELSDGAASGPVITGPSGKQMTGGFFDLSGGTS